MAEEEKDGVEIGNKWVSAKATGRFSIALILAVTVAAISIGGIGWHDHETARRYEALHLAVLTLKSAQDESTYVLTLSPADREGLRLQMPESLRRKLGRN